MKFKKYMSILLCAVLIVLSFGIGGTAADSIPSRVNILDFSHLVIQYDSINKNWAPAISAAIEYAVQNGIKEVYIPAGTYTCEGDTSPMEKWETFPVIFNLPDADITICGDGENSVLAKGRQVTNCMAMFRTAYKSDANIVLKDITIQGKHNPGSSKALIDGIVLNGSSNTVIENVTIRATKRHAIYAICGASYNTIKNINIDYVNREMLGVGLQFEGAHHNTVKNIAITNSGANAVDFNLWNTQAYYPANNGTNGSPYNASEVYYSTDNIIEGGYISGTGIMNGGVGGGGHSCDPDDDYYGLNIIFGSDNNRITLDYIENVRPESHNGNAAAVRLMGVKNNIITIGAVRTSSRSVVTLNDTVYDNKVTVGEAEGIAGQLIMFTHNLSGNNIIINDKKTYAAPDSSLTSGLTFSDWQSYWQKSKDEMTCTADGGGGIRLVSGYWGYAMITRTLKFDYPYVTLKFRYRTNSSTATVGLSEHPWTATCSPGIVADGQYHYTSIIIPYTDGEQTIMLSVNNRDMVGTGLYLEISDLRIYDHRGNFISGKNALQSAVTFSPDLENGTKGVRVNLYSNALMYTPWQLWLTREYKNAGSVLEGKAPISSTEWVLKYDYAISEPLVGLGTIQVQEMGNWFLAGDPAADHRDGTFQWQTKEVSLKALQGSEDYGRLLYNIGISCITSDKIDPDKTYYAYYRDIRIEDEFGNIVYTFFNDSVTQSQLCPQNWIVDKGAAMGLSVVDMPYTSEMRGDIDRNGEVNTDDIVRLRAILIGIQSHYYRNTADANGNGTVDITDLVRIKKMLV